MGKYLSTKILMRKANKPLLPFKAVRESKSKKITIFKSKPC